MLTRRTFLRACAALLASPAVGYARVLLHLPLPAFDFDSFDDLVPEGQAYQWVAKTIMGDEYPARRHLIVMLKNGWREVPAARYNKRFAIKGNEIEHLGCVLMERPIRQVRAARQNEADFANRMVSDWMEAVRKEGFVCAVESGRRTIDDGADAATDEERTDVWRGLKPQ